MPYYVCNVQFKVGEIACDSRTYLIDAITIEEAERTLHYHNAKHTMVDEPMFPLELTTQVFIEPVILENGIMEV